MSFGYRSSSADRGPRVPAAIADRKPSPTENLPGAVFMPHSLRTVCPGPCSRRTFLQYGSLGVGGLGLGDLLRMRAGAEQTRQPSPDTSIIFVWLPGGPPHMETYDMKPEAPAEYRGDFRPIPTVVPGIDVCELLPLHAKIAHKFTLVRSISHEFAGHDFGMRRILTGRIPNKIEGFVNDAPAGGSIVAKIRDDRRIGLPNYVAGVDNGREAVDTFPFGAAYLGRAYTPFIFAGDPSRPDFKVQNLGLSSAVAGRLDDRVGLLDGFDTLRRNVDASGAMESMDEFNRRAMDILTSDRARRAFDLSQEPDALRDRYGRHAWGQRALLARRLVEAGCSFVTMVMENPCPGQPFPTGITYNWDSHAVNCHIFVDAAFRLPRFDQAVTALVEDLYARGLDKKVLLVVTGEFGRTPRINSAIGTETRVMQPGRDHWSNAMSLLVAGGGMRTGQVIGSTNYKGEHPQDRPLTPNDLWATIYRHLGIDPEVSFPDHSGRPMPILPFGEPIAELLPA
ncbi:MAG TPA: DUF1501 domain-containing protein [Pirellulales bacterium]|nr:DUF1501 domain-containing protein [Pirellulales bacterium]